MALRWWMESSPSEGKEYTLKPKPVGRGLQCVFFTRTRRRFHSSPKCHPLRDILLTKLTFLLTVWQIIFIIRFLKNIKQCVLLYLQVNKYTLFDDLWISNYKKSTKPLKIIKQCLLFTCRYNNTHCLMMFEVLWVTSFKTQESEFGQ